MGQFPSCPLSPVYSFMQQVKLFYEHYNTSVNKNVYIIEFGKKQQHKRKNYTVPFYVPDARKWLFIKD